MLAEITSDPVYLQAATESADFIHSQLYSVQNIVQQYIYASASSTHQQCEVQVVNVDPTNSGLMLEGLSILSSITKNASTQNLLSDLIMAVIPFTGWQGNDGIVAADQEGGNMNLLQGLGTVYTRNSTNSTMRQYIGDYISVQFNAVIDLATSSGTNIYARSWTGPPSAVFSGKNQTTAIGALISALAVEFATSASTNPAPSPKSRKVAATVGGIVGVLTIAALGLTLVWFYLRRKGRSRGESPVYIPNDSPPPSAQLEPFLVSTINPASGKHTLSPTPCSSPPHSRYGEKHGGRPTADPPSISVESDTDRTSISPDRSNAYEEHVSPAGLPTEQLVEILNQRLRNRQWDEGETPPEYPVD
ncbi:Glycoside hydrolase family 76 protein [Mycena venus]|uniref:Glycoside hydrolase family 76 protein n=1 Tax=Mycena venus TaxID=2733690 RepID=A0A8H6X2I7_9AGAR|nr:Glycoside hydrolase family 76 protein [Mycena venus]